MDRFYACVCALFGRVFRMEDAICSDIGRCVCYGHNHRLQQRGSEIEILFANGEWYVLLWLDITRLDGLERQRGKSLWL